MSCASSCCNICGQASCTCGAIVCPEPPQEYTMENANLAGVGVFGAQDGLVFKMRGVGPGDDIIKVAYNNVTKVIEIRLDPLKLLIQQIWNDAVARAASTPQFKGQLGVQKDNNTLWTATGVGVGAWTIRREQQVFTNNAARAAATPHFLGQLATQLDSTIAYKGSGTNPGDWVAIT